MSSYGQPKNSGAVKKPSPLKSLGSYGNNLTSAIENAGKTVETESKSTASTLEASANTKSSIAESLTAKVIPTGPPKVSISDLITGNLPSTVKAAPKSTAAAAKSSAAATGK